MWLVYHFKSIASNKPITRQDNYFLFLHFKLIPSRGKSTEMTAHAGKHLDERKK
jgi:hypothetical protein